MAEWVDKGTDFWTLRLGEPGSRDYANITAFRRNEKSDDGYAVDWCVGLESSHAGGRWTLFDGLLTADEAKSEALRLSLTAIDEGEESLRNVRELIKNAQS